MDSDDLLAAHALEALRHASPSDGVPSSSEEGSSAATSSASNDTFLEKVSSHPIVSSAVKVYNSSKSYSPRFKYSAEKLEAVIIPRVTKRKAVQSGYSQEDGTPLAVASATGNSSSSSTTNIQPKKRPRWRRVLTTATSLAALSVESRQRLRYCLRFLKLANAHLANKLTTLQEVVDQKRLLKHQRRAAAGDCNIPSIGSLKSEIILTIRKAVTVVSTFAGNSLPEPARTHVRTSILSLPAKLALSLADPPATRTRQHSVVSSTNEEEEVFHDAVDVDDSQADIDDPDVELGGRVLSLTKESLYMLEQIILIVDETLDKADMWCEKLGKKRLEPTEEETEDFSFEVNAPAPTGM